MKGLCFLVIGLAFVISYQSNPLGTIIMGGVGILIYAFFKSRKSRSLGRGSGIIYRKGSASTSSPATDLMTLLMVQAILDRGSRCDNHPSNEKNAENKEMESLKREVLALFNED